MKILILAFLVTVSTSTYARTVARVLGIEGNAFSFYSKGKTKELKYGSKIEEMSVIMVEDDSSLSLKDEYGRVFHLAGGSQVKLFNKMLEVEKGYIWVSSTLSDSIGTINSANSITKYTQGQFIYSFDNAKGKAQVLVLSGQVQFSNIVEPNIIVDIPAGHFSFVDEEYDNGLPRSATRVGLTSYKSMKNLFRDNELIKTKSFDNVFADDTPKREIASVGSSIPKSSNSAKKGKVVFIETKRAMRIPASSETSAFDYYNDIQKAKKLKKQPARTGKVAEVNMYGFDSQEPAHNPVIIQMNPLARKPVIQDIKKSEERKPASVAPTNILNDIQSTSVFEKSLEKNYEKNKRHSDERNELIDELKSYNQVYEKQY